MSLCERFSIRNTHKLLLCCLLTALLILLNTAPLFGQVESGQISGTVTDKSGAVIPNATVTITSVATNAARTYTTSVTGAFIATDLQPAVYNVTVSSSSFATYTAKVEVTVGARVKLNPQLSVGGGAVTVEVIGEGGAQINTQTQELSQVIGVEEVASLPSLTRNPYDFVALSGNVSSGDGSSNNAAGSQNQNATARGVGFSINGQRSTGTEILLDGIENIFAFGDTLGTQVPVDGVQEYRVSTSNYEPQYGRASGGVVNVATKSGTNGFHGSVWEFNRLSAYTANTYTNDIEGLPKGGYTRNMFGFAFGGPIVKNKLFFFGSTEWTRVRSGASLLAAVPTPQFLALTAPNVQNYFTNYAGNHNFAFVNTYTAAQVGLTGIPAATPAFGTVSFNGPENAGGGVPQNTYNVLVRVDYNVSDKTQTFFRYVKYNEIDEAGADFISPYSQYNVGGANQDQAFLLSANHEFTSSLISSTKLSFSRFNQPLTFDSSLVATPALIVSPNALLPGTNTGIQLPGFYDQNPANGGLPFGGPQNTSQINQDLNWVKGKHSMQFGAQLIYIQDNNAYGAYNQASEQLGISRDAGLQNLVSGQLYEFTAAVNPNGALPCIKNPYTGALTQTAACSINLPATSPSFARSDRFKDWALYAQDAFRFTPRLTVNYGVRYEYFGVQHNNNPNLDSNFYYGNNTFNPEGVRNGQVFTAPKSPIGELWKPTYGAVSPRLGFAYDVFGNGKTSFRGGYGISYERNFGNVTFNVIQNPPGQAVVVVNNVPVTSSNAGPLAGTGGSVPLPPTSLRNVNQNIKTAQTQFYSLALEQQLAPTTFLSFQYAGARGEHLYDIKNINGLGSGNVFLGDPTSDGLGNNGLTRLNDQYSNINQRGSSGDSYYQSLNIQFQSSNLHKTGLSLIANYTWAHAIDELSTTFSETNNAFSLGYTDPFSPRLDRGNGDLDIRQRFVVAPIYHETFFSHSNRIAKEALGGWEISGIFTARTGTPFTYFDSTNDVSGYNVARYTPAAGAVPQHSFTSIPSGATGGAANAFVIGTLPTANSFSNPALLGASDWGSSIVNNLPVWPAAMTGRNVFRGPGAWNVDARLSKTFPITEQVKLQFGAEGFNLFNHHNLYIQEAENDIGAGTGGAIVGSKGGIGNNGGANDERRFGQFSLRATF